MTLTNRFQRICVIGTLVRLEPAGEEEALLVVEARGEGGGRPQRLLARAVGANARACRAHLAAGARVALEGELVGRAAGGDVDVEARRVQFLCLAAAAAGPAPAGPLDARPDGRSAA
jgi:hypothetical protein